MTVFSVCSPCRGRRERSAAMRSGGKGPELSKKLSLDILATTKPTTGYQRLSLIESSPTIPSGGFVRKYNSNSFLFPKWFIMSSSGAAAGAQRLPACLQRGCVLSPRADPGQRAFNCCVLIHRQRRLRGQSRNTEPSHRTSAQGWVNSFSSRLHITIRPSTGLAQTLGGSLLNLRRGRRSRPAPGWKTYCFPKLGGWADDC